MLKHNPVDLLPVPIDEIVEVKCGIKIVPIIDLTKESGGPGYISRDLTTIHVDMSLLSDKPSLYHIYRRVLAHEIAHSLLHQDFYSKVTYSNLSGWINVYKSIGAKDLENLEYQADALASLICVPKKRLAPAVEMALQRATQNPDFHRDSIPPKKLREYIGAYLVETFKIPADYITWRIKNDGLLPD